MLSLVYGRLIRPQLLCLDVNDLDDFEDDVFDVLLLDELLVNTQLHPEPSQVSLQQTCRAHFCLLSLSLLPFLPHFVHEGALG